MTLAATFLIYFLLGIGVAVAVYLTADQFDGNRRTYLVATALFFWPLYVPILLSRPSLPTPTGLPSSDEPIEPDEDEIAQAITRVETELDDALAGLNDWADETLLREVAPLGDLRIAWREQTRKIREMDQLLASEKDSDPTCNASTSTEHDEGRRRNVSQLAAVRERTHRQLMETLCRVRELVSLLHLARYSDDSREIRHQQVASMVQGLTSSQPLR